MCIRWERLPTLHDSPHARDWLLRAAKTGLSAATIDAYSRAVEGYLAYCRERRIAPRVATAEHVAAYLAELGAHGRGDAAQRQRLAAIRLYYAFVVEQGGRPDNPAGGAARLAPTGDAPRPGERLPWLPDEEAWLGVLAVADTERARTRLMLALAYDAALRREELCRLRVADFDPSRRILRVSAPGGASRAVRLVPEVAARCIVYLRGRAANGPADGAFFLSESPRNRARPLSIWTWSKVVQSIACRAGVPAFTTHTPRHLRLADLARAGWDADAVARFAGLSGPGSARRYLRQAGEQPEPGLADPGRRREEQLAALLARESA